MSYAIRFVLCGCWGVLTYWATSWLETRLAVWMVGNVCALGISLLNIWWPKDSA